MLLSYDLCALYRAEPRVYGAMMGDDDSEVSVQYGVHTYMGVVLCLWENYNISSFT